jgi:hypothetical protein
VQAGVTPAGQHHRDGRHPRRDREHDHVPRLGRRHHGQQRRRDEQWSVPPKERAGTGSRQANPTAVDHAVTGAAPVTTVRRAAMLTDGAARAVDPLGLYDWPNLLDLVAAQGPSALIGQVRTAEASDAQAIRWPRNKLSDDATIVYCSGFLRRQAVSHLSRPILTCEDTDDHA